MLSLGGRIKDSRKARGLSLGQLASLTGLTKGFLSQIESGSSNPSLGSLDRIAEALGLTSTELLKSDRPLVLPLVPDRPLVVSTGHTERFDASIEIVSASEAGTHLIVCLPPRTSIVGVTTHTAASILCVVISGLIEVEQAGVKVTIREGNTALWNGGKPYSLEASPRTTAQVLLFVPKGIQLPSIREFAPVESAKLADVVSHVAGRGTVSTGSSTLRKEGPLRLVAMRAQRQAERKRKP